MHQFLLEERSEQNSADLSRAENGQALLRQLGRKCRFHGVCIVDDTWASVNILPFLLHYFGTAVARPPRRARIFGGREAKPAPEDAGYNTWLSIEKRL
jgi:hypothetical protein